MPRVIIPAELTPSDLASLSLDEALYIYNGLDCTNTQEIGDKIEADMDPHERLIYGFERALQAPALDMMCFGIRVDPAKRAELITYYYDKLQRMEHILNRLAEAVWGKGLNPRSPKQKIDFFYNFLNLPVQKKRCKKTGKMKPSTDRESLEKLLFYFYVRPIINVLLKAQDYAKLLGVLRTAIDSDNRLRVSYKVAATETGRFSSSKNIFGTGTNGQNLTEKIRCMLIADPGMKLAYIDLEQAESRLVAIIVWILFGDDSYLRACESGDLHTTVCKMVWPGLAWTGDPKKDKKEVADGQKFYRDYTYRDMSKRGGHLTNYYGKPFQMAKALHIDEPITIEFQEAYFSAFPGISKWHTWVRTQLQTQKQITSFLGRRRWFFGRPNDDSTLREAIANEPQGACGDYLNLGMWRIWKYLCSANRKVRLIQQVHDAVAIQYPEAQEAEVLAEASRLLTIKVKVSHGDETREFVIPNEPKVGWNLGNFDPREPDKNPDGLKVWDGTDGRTRTREAKTSLLDISIHAAHQRAAFTK